MNLDKILNKDLDIEITKRKPMSYPITLYEVEFFGKRDDVSVFTQKVSEMSYNLVASIKISMYPCTNLRLSLLYLCKRTVKN